MFEIKVNLQENFTDLVKVISINSDIIINNSIINNSYDKFEMNQTAVSKLYETLLCRLEIMRVKSENLSLTDKYEFFRFLPIKRVETVL